MSKISIFSWFSGITAPVQSHATVLSCIRTCLCFIHSPYRKVNWDSISNLDSRIFRFGFESWPRSSGQMMRGKQRIWVGRGRAAEDQRKIDRPKRFVQMWDEKIILFHLTALRSGATFIDLPGKPWFLCFSLSRSLSRSFSLSRRNSENTFKTEP